MSGPPNLIRCSHCGAVAGTVTRTPGVEPHPARDAGSDAPEAALNGVQQRLAERAWNLTDTVCSYGGCSEPVRTHFHEVRYPDRAVITRYYDEFDAEQPHD